jgi:hypothetical protein
MPISRSLNEIIKNANNLVNIKKSYRFYLMLSIVLKNGWLLSDKKILKKYKIENVEYNNKNYNPILNINFEFITSFKTIVLAFNDYSFLKECVEYRGDFIFAMPKSMITNKLVSIAHQTCSDVYNISHLFKPLTICNNKFDMQKLSINIFEEYNYCWCCGEIKCDYDESNEIPFKVNLVLSKSDNESIEFFEDKDVFLSKVDETFILGFTFKSSIKLHQCDNLKCDYDGDVFINEFVDDMAEPVSKIMNVFGKNKMNAKSKHLKRKQKNMKKLIHRKTKHSLTV